MMRLRFPICSLLLMVFYGGCSPEAFSPHFHDNRLDDLKKALQQIAPRELAPRNNMGVPLIFVVTQKPTRIIAYDLKVKATMWDVPIDATSKVAIGRDRLFLRTGKSTLESRDVTTGEKQWAVPLEGGDRLLGLTTNGENVFYAMENSSREASSTAHLVAVAGSTGKTLWSAASKGRLGAPVARGNRVFLPLRYQSIAIVDALTGAELARVRSKEEALLWVRDSPGGILFGSQKGVYHLDERSVSGTQAASTFLAPHLPRNIRSSYYWDGYNAALSGYTAFDRNRLIWNISPEGNDFMNHLIVVHNYRFFFAFDTRKMSEKESGLTWAYSNPRQDVIAAELSGPNLIMVSADGEIRFIDPSNGQIIGQQSLGVQVQGASFDVDGFAAPNKAGEPLDLRKTLAEIIWDPDRRFGMVKLFCVEQLAQLSGEKVAEDLVKIVSHEKVDPAVYKRAGEMIVSRHDAASIPLYLDALKSHYDFIEGTQGQAVDILAQALGDLKAKEGIRPLLLHLADHETPLPAVESIIKALIAIGDKVVLEPFRDYLLTYRCDPIFDKSPGVLTALVEGLLKLGGENERRLLSFVENDAGTLAFLRTYLQKALGQTVPTDKQKQKQKKRKKHQQHKSAAKD